MIAASPAALDAPGGDDAADARTPEERIGDEMIAKARQTSASIRFIEDASLIEPAGGVGAFLRFKL